MIYRILTPTLAFLANVEATSPDGALDKMARMGLGAYRTWPSWGEMADYCGYARETDRNGSIIMLRRAER